MKPGVLLRHVALPLFLFVLALAIRWDAVEGFDGLYGQDAFAYYDYGVAMHHTFTTLESPPPMYWGLGFPGMLGVVFTLFGDAPEVGLWLVMLMGALLPVWVYGLTLTLLDGHGGALVGALSAGLVVAWGGQALQSSLVLMSDIPALFWATLSAWGLVVYARRCRQDGCATGWLVAAVLCLAIGGMTRWIVFLLALPWAGVCLWAWHGRILHRDALLAVVLGGGLLAVQLWHSSLNPEALAGHSWLREWSLLHAGRSEFVNADGAFTYPQTMLAFYGSMPWHALYGHPFVAALMGIGGVALVWLRRPAALIVLGGWVLVSGGFLAGIPYQNIRFGLAFWVPLAVLTGVGAAVIVVQPSSYRLRGGLAVVLLVGTAAAMWPSVNAGREAASGLIATKQRDLTAVRWALETIPEEDAAIYSVGLWTMMRHYMPHVDARQLYYERPGTLARRDTAQPAYVLVNAWMMHNRWGGLPQRIAFDWLDAHPGLAHVGQHGHYHLYRVAE